MKNTLDAMTKTRDAIQESADRLLNLASAFRKTGNDYVAEKLEFEVEMMTEVVKPLLKAWNDDIDLQMGHSKAMMGGILDLALNCEITPLKEK